MGGRPKALRLLAFGLIAGVASGLLGVGGGILLVPLLAAAGFEQHRAHATSLAAIVPIALAGTATFASQASVSWPAAAALAAGAVVGAPLGARAMAATGARGLRLAFGLVTAAVGLAMVLA